MDTAHLGGASEAAGRSKPVDRVVSDPRSFAWVASEDVYQITGGEDGPSLFPDGGQVVICTSWAIQARRLLGARAAIYGFYCADNPDATAMARLADGHDFAVIDGRWILDGWLVHVEGSRDNPVIDLLDPAESETIRRFYGDPAKWERSLDLESTIDSERPPSRREALEGVRHPEVLKAEIARRGLIAAGLFGWSQERIRGFQDELAAQVHVPARGIALPAPEAFGLAEEDVWSPGKEAGMSPAIRRAMGRYDAAAAFASWDQPDQPEASHEADVGLARMFCDRADFESTDPDSIRFDPAFDISQLSALYSDNGPLEWLRLEHRHSIADGRSGYADLLLQKVREPCVYLEYDDGGIEIADGWHRTAAALAAGETHLHAVMVPLMRPLEQQGPDW